MMTALTYKTFYIALFITNVLYNQPRLVLGVKESVNRQKGPMKGALTFVRHKISSAASVICDDGFHLLFVIIRETGCGS